MEHREERKTAAATSSFTAVDARILVAGSKQTYLDEGFDAYLTKPLDSATFEETVRSMLPEGLVRQMEQN